MFKMPWFGAWRRGVSEVLTFETHLQGLATSKAPLSPKQTLACCAALVNWHPCLGLELSPLYTSPSFSDTHALTHTHMRMFYNHTHRYTLSFTLIWNEWECGSSFYFFLPPFLSVFLHPFMSYSFHRSKAIWLKPATPVRHQHCCTSR